MKTMRNKAYSSLTFLLASFLLTFAVPCLALSEVASAADPALASIANDYDARLHQYDLGGAVQAARRYGGGDVPDEVYDAHGHLCVDMVEVRALDDRLVVPRGRNLAFDIAEAGGKHAGTLKNFAGRSAAEIQKGIGSYERQVALHQQKLANPA